MPKARIARRIRHAPDALFSMVSDVEKYPDFIELISALRITKKLSDTEFEAEAIVAYKMIRESFRSHIRIYPDDLRISVEKAEKGGAVKSLLNDWRFHPLSDGSTLVDAIVDVRLKAYPLEYILREKFDRIAEEIINVFQTEAGKRFELVGDVQFDGRAEFAAVGVAGEGIL